MCDVKKDIQAIVNQQKIFARFNTDEEKCTNLENANEQIETACQLEKQHWDKLVEDVNEYIGYPTKRRWGIFPPKKAKLGYDSFLQTTTIKIPKIEKQEYYCVINYLNNYKYSCVINNSYVIDIQI